ncbi:MULTISPECIES: tail assembly chaperone [Companilactobacillus]|uniref:Phage protein n=1 Tax=Companilactobacillus ginsenosidimutans TaxID=1007676 RepID=A0A0H4QCT2_9LACO|nr:MULTISPECIES: tail assembly chaperone [Companilactobacillus]AKP66103.1 hypothetical protein ABM34_00030 [Companilactobacillus ginsenosidimutans]AKP66139.1 hypothetical protein ABM34_00270 [Companilactobacillus ginsenosidimutans]
MNIKVNDKEFELNFGIGFLRELDKVAGVDVQGISMGMALTRTLPALKGWDMLALINALYCATHADNPRPSYDDVANAVGSQTDKQIEKLFTDVLAELKKSPVVRFSVNKLTQN